MTRAVCLILILMVACSGESADTKAVEFGPPCMNGADVHRISGELDSRNWELAVGFRGKEEYCPSFVRPGESPSPAGPNGLLQASAPSPLLILGGDQRADSELRYIYGFAKPSVSELRLILVKATDTSMRIAGSGDHVVSLTPRDWLFLYPIEPKLVVSEVYGLAGGETIAWCSQDDKAKNAARDEFVCIPRGQMPFVPNPPAAGG